MPDFIETVMPDFFETVMPDLIGHPGFACMDTRVRGYDKDMDTGLRGYDKKVVMPDLIGYPCLQKAGSSDQARG
jgi:hypothetical protein